MYLDLIAQANVIHWQAQEGESNSAADILHNTHTQKSTKLQKATNFPPVISFYTSRAAKWHRNGNEDDEEAFAPIAASVCR